MATRVLLFALLAGSFLLTACIPGGRSPLAGFGGPTPTPTPFLPAAAFDSEIQDLTVALQESRPQISGMLPAHFDDFLPPTLGSDIDIPAPVGRFIQPAGQVNVLLLGSDQRPNDGGFRTDVVLLLTLNPNQKSVSLTSFPRDLYVYAPGWHVDRINGVFAKGGIEMTADMLEYNFGVRPDHYVLVNFGGFETIVNALGGITVQVAQPLTDERDGLGDFSVPAGPVSMDGETALWYVRSRGTSSDFDRTLRTQEVLVAMFHRLLSLDALGRAPELYAQYQQTVTTDLELKDLLPLFPLASDLSAGQGEIARYAVGVDLVTPFTTSMGGAVLLPNFDQVLEMMRLALNVE
ncbi:MAG: LCP family protein [Anaerolineales bacterium]